MAGRGTRATATDYNNIQSTIASIMGLGSGTTGYGQAVTSTQVAPGATITVAQWVNIRNDLSKARVHQTNSAVVDGLASISANRGSPWQTLQLVTASTTISEDIRDQYNQFATGTQSNKDTLAASGQSTSGVALTSSTRSTNWGGTSLVQSVSHILTVTFAGYTSGSLTVPNTDHSRCFFNAGGSIQIVASRTGTAANTKDTDWTTMLSGFGTFTFRNTGSAVSGTLNSPGSVASAVGFSNLSIGGAATTVLTQASSASKYAENRYTIQVSRPTAATLQFTITFQDADVGDRPVPSPPPPFGPLVDEPVTGTLLSTVTCTRPSGSNVDVPAPSATTTTVL